MRTVRKTTLLSTIFSILILSTINFGQNIDLPITTSSDDARNIFREGRAYLENVHVTRAAELFDKAIDLDNDFALAHLFRAGTFVGGFNVARDHLDIAVGLIDKVTGGEKNLILYQQAVSDGDQVRQKMFLDNLIVSFPYNKRIQQLAGNYYFGISDYETALKHLRKSIKIDEDFAPSYNMIGYAESSLENYDAAETAFKKYIDLMPEHPNPYDSYAELLQTRGRYDESIAQYQKAYEKDNTFLTALTGIGHNHVFKGEYDKARELYNQSLSNSTTINQKLGSLFWTATSHVHEGNIDEAMKVLSKRKKMAKKEGLTNTVIGATNLEGFILTETGHEKKGMKKFQTANKMIETSTLPKEVKSRLALNGRINMCYALTANDKIAEAEKEAMDCEKMVNTRSNPNEIQNLHGTLALLEMKKGNYQAAIDHFEKTDLNNTPYNLQKIGIAYEKMGNTQMANQYFNKVKTANQNGMGYALIRQSARD